MKKLILTLGALSLLLSTPVYAFTSNVNSTTLVKTSLQYFTAANAVGTGLHISAASSKYTICAWVKLNSTGLNQMIAMKNNDGGATQFEWALYLDTANKLATDLVDQASAIGAAGHWQRYKTDAAQNGSTGVWYHDCVTVDFNSGTPTVVFYVNGSSVASSKTNGTTIGSTAYASGSGASWVGYGTEFDASDYVDGLMDDVLVANTAFSSGSISSLKTTPCAFSDSSTQARLRLDGNGNDDTANANNFTGTNSPTYTTDVPYTCPASGVPVDTTQGWFMAL